MDRSLAMLVIGLVFGGGIGFVIAAGNGITLDGHDHGNPADHHGTANPGDHGAADASHGHGRDQVLALPDDADAPTLEIAIAADPASGWNLHIQTTNFRFSPRNASLDYVPGEGHAHVYVNGAKIARQYGPWLHIAALPTGDNTVEVSLNANDHRPLAVGGEPLVARVSVTVP